MSAETEKFLQDFAKIKSDVHEKIGLRYDRAADAQTQLLKLDLPLAERKKNGPAIRSEMKAVADELPGAEKKIEALHCPPVCKSMTEHYISYLKTMEKEVSQCIRLIDLSMVERPDNKVFASEVANLEGIHTSRNLEMANYVAELKKIAAGLGPISTATP